LIPVTPANTGCKPRRRRAQSKRSRHHEANDDTGRSGPSCGLSRLIEDLSHSAIGFRRFKSGSGGDQPRQVCSVVVWKFACRACHEGPTCFRPQLGIGRSGSPIRPEKSVDFIGEKSGFALRGTLNYGRSHGGVRERSHHAQQCPENDRQGPN
jgi:hypothetical protein